MAEFLGLPPLASEHGAQVDWMILAIHNVMLLAFVGWLSFFIIPLFRYRQKKRPRANYRGFKGKFPFIFVAILAAVELVLLAFVSLPFWEREVAALPTDEDLVELRIVAQQFAWNVHYPGEDGVFGETAVEYVDSQTNPLGISPEDPYGEDDFTSLNQVHLPVGKRALIWLTSKDVVHSLGLPDFRVKQDAIPGMTIPVHFVPTMTTEELREQTNGARENFEIVCSQLCGLSHYRMRGFVVVESEEAFAAWKEERLQYMDWDDW